MENLSMIENYSEQSNEFFKVDYKGQLLKDNIRFQTFKKEQQKKYGSNAKLYYSKNEEVYFYAPSKNNSSILFEASRKCPLNGYNICYFCSSHAYTNCCSKNNFYRLFFEHGLTFIDNVDVKLEKHKVTYKQLYPKFFIPLYTYIYLIGIISFNLFHGLRYNGKNKERNFYFQENCSGGCSIVLNFFYGIILYLIFFIHTIYFKLLILISSIFFKKRPFRYYIGIIGFGVDQFQ